MEKNGTLTLKLYDRPNKNNNNVTTTTRQKKPKIVGEHPVVF